mmetsp:Transcript_30649/g.89079  ORF Transcript_30649/g.89079 Transcript_30649/m.89079 type:complete len:265 (+) Transcript_30649:3-797(+)
MIYGACGCGCGGVIIIVVQCGNTAICVSRVFTLRLLPTSRRASSSSCMPSRSPSRRPTVLPRRLPWCHQQPPEARQGASPWRSNSPWDCRGREQAGQQRRRRGDSRHLAPGGGGPGLSQRERHPWGARESLPARPRAGQGRHWPCRRRYQSPGGWSSQGSEGGVQRRRRLPFRTCPSGHWRCKCGRQSGGNALQHATKPHGPQCQDLAQSRIAGARGRGTQAEAGCVFEARGRCQTGRRRRWARGPGPSLGGEREQGSPWKGAA